MYPTLSVSVELADHNHSRMRRIAADGVAWSMCLYVHYGDKHCKNGWTDRHAIWLRWAHITTYYMGIRIPPGEGEILRVGKHGHYMPRDAHGWFTKWHGSLMRRCGLLSNYFDLLLFYYVDDKRWADGMLRWRAFMTCGQLHMDLFTCWLMHLESLMIIPVFAASSYIHSSSVRF